MRFCVITYSHTVHKILLKIIEKGLDKSSGKSYNIGKIKVLSKMIFQCNYMEGVLRVEEKKKRGGKREGSGRKPSPIPKNTYSFYLSEEEHEAVKRIIAMMRANYSKK